MSSTTTRLITVCLALVAGAQSSRAHETWLIPTDAHPVEGTELRWSLASGMAFGKPGSPITRDRIVVAKLHDGEGQVRPLTVDLVGEGATTLLSSAAGGVHCAEIVLRPRLLTLDPEKIQPYFEEIGATPQMREAWAASATPQLWRETYTKYAKAIVRVGQAQPAADQGCWSEHLGHPLEFVPQSDPTHLNVGDDLRLMVLDAGEGAVGQAVGLAHEDGTYFPLKRADAQGAVSFALPTPGKYMVFATRLMRSTAPDEDWTSDFATLVFAID